MPDKALVSEWLILMVYDWLELHSVKKNDGNHVNHEIMLQSFSI
jgi:hypothetical protein